MPLFRLDPPQRGPPSIGTVTTADGLESHGQMSVDMLRQEKPHKQAHTLVQQVSGRQTSRGQLISCAK